MRTLLAFLLVSASFQIQGQNPDFLAGEMLYAEGRYDSSTILYQKAKEYYQSQVDTLAILKTDYMLGRSMYNSGRCSESIEILQAAIDRNRTFFGDSLGLLSFGYHHLSRALGGCQSKHEEALTTIQKSNEINAKLYGADSPKMAKNHNFMAYFHIAMGNYDSADLYLKKALEIWHLGRSIDSLEYARTLYNRTQVFTVRSQFDSALVYGTRALSIYRGSLVANHPTISNCLSRVGRIYSRRDDFDQALEYYLQALEIRKKTLGAEHANVGSSYLSIGDLYGKLYNYERAIHFLSQGCNILEKRFGDGLPVLHTYYAYLGRMHSKLKQFDEAKKLFDRAERLADGYERSKHPFKAFIYNAISDFYADMGDLDGQVTYLNSFLEINQELHGKGTLQEADALVKLAEAYVNRDELLKAEELFEKANSIYETLVDPNNGALTTYYAIMGDLSRKKSDYLGSVSQYQKSLSTLYGKQLPNTEFIDIERFSHKYRAFRAAFKAADSYYKSYEANGDTIHLSASLDYANLAYSLIDKLATAYRMELSRSQLEKEGRDFFGLTMKMLFDYYQLTGKRKYAQLAFSFSERSKSPILKSKLEDSRAMKVGKVSDQLLAEERELRSRLSYYQSKLRTAKLANDSLSISNYQGLVFDIQESFETLKKNLRAENIGYYSFYYENRLISEQEIQSKLDPNEAVVAFFQGNEIYRFTISKNDFHFEKMADADSIRNLASTYARSLSDSDLIIENPQMADSLFSATAYALYTHLLKSPIERWGSEVNRIVIVPDGFISQLNFSTLLKDPEQKQNYSRYNYLLNDYSISYAYSATFYEKDDSQSGSLKFGGFAPSYPIDGYQEVDTALHPMVYALVRDGRLPLPGAIDEVALISEIVGGESWLNESASETNFKTHSGKYDILHLAMHSLLNDQDPDYSELLFNAESDSLNDGFLTINEIYNLEVNADLVVLSACSSGSGKLEVGEGPISFSRAFSYAGSPSVVMSLWKVPDVATSQIMVSFYEKLIEGKEKDIALREAQLEFLESQEDPILKHPFYWAGFVTLGDVKPLRSSSVRLYQFFGLSLLALVLVVVLRRRFTNQ